MKPMIINGQWRVVYDGALDWVKQRGLANQPASNIIFESYDDAYAYLDSIRDYTWCF